MACNRPQTNKYGYTQLPLAGAFNPRHAPPGVPSVAPLIWPPPDNTGPGRSCEKDRNSARPDNQPPLPYINTGDQT